MKKAFINIRIFSHPPTNNEHSFYVGHEAGGLSERVDTVTINEDHNFHRMREQIEEQHDGNIMRRRPNYTEFLQFMQRCPNPFGYKAGEVMTYRIGVLKVKDDKTFFPSANDIKVIKERDETKPICEVVDDLLGSDIVFIPTTQIDPATGRLSINSKSG